MIIDPLKSFGEREWLEAGRPTVLVTPSTGTDHIDLAYFEGAGVHVLSLRDDREGLNGIYASSEFTLLAILMGLCLVHQHIGKRFRAERGHELHGKTVGFIGYGRIGRNVSTWCCAIGSSTWFYDPYVLGGFPLERIFAESDVVCITCALTPETTHMVDYSLLSKLKEGAVLVNTARGAVINSDHLIAFLKARLDVTAVLDVLEGELDGSHVYSELWELPNIILTPHIAGYTVESNEKAMAIARRLDALCAR